MKLTLILSAVLMLVAVNDALPAAKRNISVGGADDTLGKLLKDEERERYLDEMASWGKRDVSVSSADAALSSLLHRQSEEAYLNAMKSWGKRGALSMHAADSVLVDLLTLADPHRDHKHSQFRGRQGELSLDDVMNMMARHG